MKHLPALLLSLTIFIAAPVFAHEAAKPMHGGTVAHVNELDFELVAQPERLQLFVHDHGRVIDLSNASAKVSLLSGAQKQDAELKVVEGRLEAAGSYNVAPGSKAVAVVSLNGKTHTARFTLK